jgi:hypothetical protein
VKKQHGGGNAGSGAAEALGIPRAQAPVAAGPLTPAVASTVPLRRTRLPGTPDSKHLLPMGLPVPAPARKATIATTLFSEKIEQLKS